MDATEAGPAGPPVRRQAGHRWLGINVRSIVGIAIGGHVVVTAWTEPTEIHLFLVDLVGDRKPMKLTTNPGVHNAVLGRADDGRAADGDVLLAVTSARPAADGVEVAIRRLVLPSDDSADNKRSSTNGAGGTGTSAGPTPTEGTAPTPTAQRPVTVRMTSTTATPWIG